MESESVLKKKIMSPEERAKAFKLAIKDVLLPIRCYTCGKVLADKQSKFEELVIQGASIEEAMDRLGIWSNCCRTRVMNPGKYAPGPESITKAVRLRRSQPRAIRLKNVLDTASSLKKTSIQKARMRGLPMPGSEEIEAGEEIEEIEEEFKEPEINPLVEIKFAAEETEEEEFPLEEEFGERLILEEEEEEKERIRAKLKPSTKLIKIPTKASTVSKKVLSPIKKTVTPAKKVLSPIKKATPKLAPIVRTPVTKKEEEKEEEKKTPVKAPVKVKITTKQTKPPAATAFKVSPMNVEGQDLQSLEDIDIPVSHYL